MHTLTAFNIGLPDKPRTGDCYTHFELPDEGLIVAAVADGVGSPPFRLGRLPPPLARPSSPRSRS
jgi:hypothetical protein